MDWFPILIALCAGFILGLLAALALRLIQSRTAKELADELYRENIENVKESFGNLSFEALSKATNEFLKLAKEKLESEREVSVKELGAKKELIDQQLQRMTTQLEDVTNLTRELEKDRVKKYEELASQLKRANEQTTALLQTTNTLREALASTRARGQWGERMAEDVLRLAGFIENVNYLKNKAIEGVGSRPDFTFLLPRELRLNMDVKFPFENYVKYLDADLDSEKEKFCKAFLKDVKSRIKEVTNREYINPEQNTVDYVLLFIPNEQIYAFIHEQDSSILDDGIRNKVVFCSPITLFAVLAVIRQAVDNFTLNQTSNEILSLLSAFRKQWVEFLKRLEQMGKRIGDAQKEYDALVTTRKGKLEKPLNKLESLRKQRGLPIAPYENEDSLPAVDEIGEDEKRTDRDVVSGGETESNTL